jgi:hypothetical protein
MSAPESRPDIESTLADAFTLRHERQRPSHPSLVDVRRRAHRRASRRATARAGAVVAAGATVLAGGWTVSRGATSSSDEPAVPTMQSQPPTSTRAEMRTLSVDGLWAAVAAHLDTTVELMRTLNPTVDFDLAPVPGTPLVVHSGPAVAPEMTTVVLQEPTTVGPRAATTTTTTTLAAPPAASVGIPETTTTTTTVVDIALSVNLRDCALTDAQIDALTEQVRSIPAPGHGIPSVTLPGVPAWCTLLPPMPTGWTLYQIVAGDYLYELAERFCTTPEELVAANAWSDGVNTPVYPGQLISVPAQC